jgi:hypothetical protein
MGFVVGLFQEISKGKCLLNSFESFTNLINPVV